MSDNATENQPPKDRDFFSSYLVAYRDHWYHTDFLNFQAERLGLGEAKTLVEFGCGRGHWLKQLAPLMPEAHLTGLDHDASFVNDAQAWAREAGLAARTRFVVASAERTDFADDSFDVATTQTLLPHVADRQAIIREMARVTKPGGVILCVEPNTISQMLSANSVLESYTSCDVLALVEFELRVQRGRRSLGRGFMSPGEVLTEDFYHCGLQDIKSVLSDRRQTFIPPYNSVAEQAYISLLQGLVEQEHLHVYPRAIAHEFFLAGEGSPAAWQRCSEVAARYFPDILRAMQARKFFGTFFSTMHFVSARKPLNH